MLWMPAIDLISVDLPAPFVADERHYFTAMHFEVDDAERLDRPEGLRDVTGARGRGFVGH